MVEVEVDLASGLPAFALVGLPDAAVRESRERVRAAVSNSDLAFPVRRITVNLAPADLRKEGPQFDLPVALGVLAASGQVPGESLENLAVLGELSLTGEVRPVRGALPAAIAAREAGLDRLLLPEGNAAEAAVVKGLAVYPVRTLLQGVSWLRGEERLLPVKDTSGQPAEAASDPDADFADVRGQEHVKRALEIAAAGGHNLVMIGPPGAGKTMLARRLPSILPPLTYEEALEITKIHSVAGLIPEGSGLMRARPFRSPHHTISDVGLVGGGSTAHVGEISLAHLGVLFLDELPEFPRHVLDVLRQPLEDGRITVTRAGYTVDFPARVSLVAAMNPCPCGHLTDPRKGCRCSAREIRNYQARISGPLLDRIDLHVEVPPVGQEELTAGRDAEPSAAMRARVVAARARQEARFRGTRAYTNAGMSSRSVRKHCPLDHDSRDLLSSATEQFGLSARAWDRILKVARTVADLEGAEVPSVAHVAEALQYRVLDRSGW